MDDKTRLLTISNALTASRLVFLPIIIAGIALHVGVLAAVAMGLAFLTDLLDGRVARYLKQSSQFGASLDSTVDFIFLHLLFVAFYAVHSIHTYQFLVIYVAMLTTLAVEYVSSVASRRGEEVKTRFSKPLGAFEYVYLLFLVARMLIHESKPVVFVDLATFLAIAVCVVLFLRESFVCLNRFSKHADESLTTQ